MLDAEDTIVNLRFLKAYHLGDMEWQSCSVLERFNLKQF